MLKYIRNHVKEVVRNFTIRWFMSKRNDLKKLSTVHFNASSCNKENIINSSVIVKCSKEGQVKYFRESRRHLKLRRHVLMAVEDYFNVSRAANVQIWCGCCENVSIRNTSSIPILVQNANVIITPKV